jgi:hypothetical protein
VAAQVVASRVVLSSTELVSSEDPATSPIMSQMNPDHEIPSYSSDIDIRAVLSSMSECCNYVFRFKFVTENLYAFVFSPMRATCLRMG